MYVLYLLVKSLVADFEDYIEICWRYQEASLSDGRYGANGTSEFSRTLPRLEIE